MLVAWGLRFRELLGRGCTPQAASAGVSLDQGRTAGGWCTEAWAVELQELA